MSAAHGLSPVIRGCGAIPVAGPSLLAGHGPLHVARGRSLVAVVALGLSARHGPLRAARDRGPTVVAGFWWTCGLDSSAGGQR